MALDLLFERFLVPGPGRPPRHRPGHRVRPARGGHPVRLREIRPGLRRPGRQRDHLPGPLGGAGHGQGAGLLARAAGRLEQADRPLGAAEPGRRTTPTSPNAVLALAAELEGFPRHLGIHSGGMVICARPVAEVCPVEWARMDEPHRWCSGTRTTARRPAWSSSTCWGSACCRRCTTRSIWWPRLPAPGAAFDLQPTEPAVYAMLCPGRLGRGVPGGVPRADGHPAAAETAARSTTWWWRSR